MGLNVKCPRCGSEKVQLMSEKSGNELLKFLIFGGLYVMWHCCKWCIGLCILCLFDWWMAIIYAVKKKPYTWISKRFFSLKRRLYYCHECSNNFRA